MGLDQSNTASTLIYIPPAELLSKARARLQRQKQYARVLERGGNRASGLQSLLSQASDCIATLAQPCIALRPVQASVHHSSVQIAGLTQVENQMLAKDVASGGTVTAYLVTLGFSQNSAFQWLNGDYGAHHVQSDLSNEVLFKLGRIAHRKQFEQNVGARLKRISVQVNDVCGQGKVWDPKKVQSLLSVFDDISLDVSVTNSGCFQPLNSLLGLTIALPPHVGLSSF